MKIIKPPITPFNAMNNTELVLICINNISKDNPKNFSKELLGFEYTQEELRNIYNSEECNKEEARHELVKKYYRDPNYIKQIEAITVNPLKLCEHKNKTLIEPNKAYYEKGKTLKNVSVIKNLFKDSLIIYECNNNKRYLDLPNTNELLEYPENKQFDAVSYYYGSLEEITKTMVNLRTLSNLPPVKEIEANEDVISFTDGLFNLKTSKKINKITLENIPKTHLNIQYEYTPSETDIKQTKAILEYVFKDPNLLICRLKDIFFNRNILKGYTIIYGVTGSGKSVFLSKVLGRLTNNKSVDVSNFNNHLERESLITSGLSISCDEIQKEPINASFLNKYTSGSGIKVAVGRKFKSSIEIKPVHVFLAGENVPMMVSDTSGSYARPFVLETHNIFKKLNNTLMDYLETKEFINTLFYLIKECYKETPELTEIPMDINKYNNYRRDLIAVLGNYIYSNPNANDYLTKGKNGITCKLMKYNETMKNTYSPEFLEVNTGYRLDIEAIKELVKYLQENNLIDTQYSLDSNFSRKLSSKILPSVIDEYDNSNQQVIRIGKKTPKVKLDITPNPEALEILKKQGLNIDEYRFINDILEENAYLL